MMLFDVIDRLPRRAQELLVAALVLAYPFVGWASLRVTGVL